MKKNYPPRMNCPHMEYSTRGGALLLEHLPGRGKYPDGVLFIIFSNGEAYFYPLEQFDDGHYDAHTNRATLISSDSSTFTRSAGKTKQLKKKRNTKAGHKMNSKKMITCFKNNNKQIILQVY